MSAEYKLQLTKIVELEDKFTKGFFKDKWGKCFTLDIEINIHRLFRWIFILIYTQYKTKSTMFFALNSFLSIFFEYFA